MIFIFEVGVDLKEVFFEEKKSCLTFFMDITWNQYSVSLKLKLDISHHNMLFFFTCSIWLFFGTCIEKYEKDINGDLHWIVEVLNSVFTD